MGKTKNRRKPQNQSSSESKSSENGQPDHKRTEEDIQNDDKELAHFRDVFILYIL